MKLYWNVYDDAGWSRKLRTSATLARCPDTPIVVGEQALRMHQSVRPCVSLGQDDLQESIGIVMWDCFFLESFEHLSVDTLLFLPGTLRLLSICALHFDCIGGSQTISKRFSRRRLEVHVPPLVRCSPITPRTEADTQKGDHLGIDLYDSLPPLMTYFEF